MLVFWKPCCSPASETDTKTHRCRENRQHTRPPTGATRAVPPTRGSREETGARAASGDSFFPHAPPKVDGVSQGVLFPSLWQAGRWARERSIAASTEQNGTLPRPKRAPARPLVTAADVGHCLLQDCAARISAARISAARAPRVHAPYAARTRPRSERGQRWPSTAPNGRPPAGRPPPTAFASQDVPDPTAFRPRSQDGRKRVRGQAEEGHVVAQG